MRVSLTRRRLGVGAFLSLVLVVGVTWFLVDRTDRVPNACPLVSAEDIAPLVAHPSKRAHRFSGDHSICKWTEGREELVVEVERYAGKGGKDGKWRAGEVIARYVGSSGTVVRPPDKKGRVDEVREWLSPFSEWYMHIALRFDDIVVFISYEPDGGVKGCGPGCADAHEPAFHKLAEDVMKKFSE
ncbi:hypothetical protein [Actinomadura montaniterrae]|uniref:Uncharacterized protein n=1 Tax=Actinomadura montaniterrae TaxID=1803903 RepID=A0A6L3VPU4_9ACTN|nr:hypothetical protein [Actinomadura montaniterrae]KAB2374364.1 hypothetical protein F9B16_27700 [Actinomadura montaniterrae]